MKIIPIREIKDKLDSVSPTMCLAKWTQSTIYLNSGHTHSCHHPDVHPIPLEGLANPSTIHNTPKKQELRRQMLDGVKLQECNYCWRIEDLNQNLTSDRMYKSSAPWSSTRFDEVIQSKEGSEFAPSYLEVLFETTCNFACVYCSPNVSSKWHAESLVHGPYLTSEGSHGAITERSELPIKFRKDDSNPYVDAFWDVIGDWWPTLDTFRITGGEPLLSKHTWAMLDYVEANANPNLQFAINTNLGVPDDKIQKLVERVNDIQNSLRRVSIYTSFEATGKQSEYIRYGMEYDKFISNFEKVLSETSAHVVIMTTINILSYSTFGDFVRKIHEYKKQYGDRVSISFNFLRDPIFLDMKHLPRSLKDVWLADMATLHPMLNRFESDSLKRVEAYLDVELPLHERTKNLLDLKMVTDQIEQRRGMKFSEYFPELNSFL